jgi:hypothetical protein
MILYPALAIKISYKPRLRARPHRIKEVCSCGKRITRKLDGGFIKHHCIGNKQSFEAIHADTAD